MKVAQTLAITCAGALPVIAAGLAWQINISHGLTSCLPFWDGCVSVSRGIRSGPGLAWFKILALPSSILMAASWWLQYAHFKPVLLRVPARHRLITWMGIAGACFFLVYALFLGAEGEIYRWMRRYGVVFYFGLTGLAHLLLAAALWRVKSKLKNGLNLRAVNIYALVVMFAWLAGVGSAFKRRLTDNPALVDRLENALEWNFALLLCLCFVALALVLTTRKAHEELSSQAAASGNT